MSLIETLQANHLALEPLIAERLRARLPANVAVLTASQLARIEERLQPCPCAHLIYDGEGVDEINRSAIASQPVRQNWLIVVAVRNVDAGAIELTGVLG